VRLYAEDPGRSSRGDSGLTPDSILWRRSNVDSSPVGPVFVVYSDREDDCPPRDVGKAGSPESPFELLHYVERKLANLRKLQPDWDGDDGKPPTGDSLIAMHQAIKGVADRRTIYPFLNPDGSGGVIAEWHADGQVLEILTAASGATYFYGKDSAGELLIDAPDEDAHTMRSSGYRQSNRRQFRRLLVSLSAYVHHQNPTWRELFK
jgi:hypothetical protein